MTRAALATLILLSAALSAPALAGAVSGPSEWRLYDANDDGCLDKADTRILFGDGLWRPTVDVNGDGQKNSGDAFALMVLMTKWDRSADMKTNDDDFGPQEPVSLPEPDVAAATSLASRLLVDAAAKLPVGQEERLMQEWPTFQFLARPEQAALLDEAGMLALAEHNLDVAQWAFARALDRDPSRASALSNLGFTLCEQGRGADALTLLSRARQMDPRSAVASNNIGWVFARTGQDDEAGRFYREAIKAAPSVAQYQLNLGVVLLRKGNDDEARQAFAQAARLNPDDREALLMSVATSPLQPAAMEAYRAKYEQDRDEFNKQLEEEHGFGPDGGMPAWESAPPSDKIEQIVRQEEERIGRQRDDVIAALTQETKDKLRETVKPVQMQGKSAREDWARFWEGFPGTFEALQTVISEADLRACQVATEYEKRAAAAILGLDRTILELALTQAQADMAAYRDGAEARQAFEKTVDTLYEERMRRAAERLRNAHGTLHLDLSPEDRETREASLLTFMAIVGAAFGDEAYGKDFDEAPKPGAMDKINFKMDEEPTFGLSLGMVGAEWKPESNEFKLQVGQGIIVAGTWSPARGFGFQAGTGVSFTEGAFKVSAANYVKFGSDGSITVDYKVGGGMAGPNLGTKWSGSMSTTVQAATHEPIGTW
jgi:tetratricopeptide (TPR) repeat protein